MLPPLLPLQLPPRIKMGLGCERESGESKERLVPTREKGEGPLGLADLMGSASVWLVVVGCILRWRCWIDRSISSHPFIDCLREYKTVGKVGSGHARACDRSLYVTSKSKPYRTVIVHHANPQSLASALTHSISSRKRKGERKGRERGGKGGGGRWLTGRAPG